ncbi:sensor histidine kinase [Maribacter halichondriae]|uniref:sensor histidine kinase n=1 Tax=Maribacter halichondriae TaxID=2980554 RepID=UPI0023586E07|nr:histidine kinase dimerization/phosphoacceptor domain -containing protein [Maribacter sp. Hal144]
MQSFFYKAICFCILSFLNCGLTLAQIIDFESEKPYKKVFVDTDNFGTSYLDTLEQAYPKARPDSLKFSILNDLAYYWHTRNLPKAMDFTEIGLQLTSAKKNILWQGRFQITQGAILLRMEKLDEAERVLENAKTKVRETDLAHLITQLGYVHERRGKLGSAADFALETLSLGQKLNDKRAMAMAYSDLSNLFWKQSKFEAGLEYGLKSLALFEERGINDLDYDFTLFVVGNNYVSLNEFDKALNYFQHSVAIGERYGFYNNLSDAYIYLLDLYAYQNEFEKAEEAGADALKYAELLDNNFMTMRSWLSIGKLYNLQGKYSGAIESLQKCITIATDEFGDNFFLSQAYEALGKAYAGNYQYQEAYQALAEYDKYKSAVFTAEADQRISRLRTEFDVAQKESTIELQETQIIKQRTRQNLFLIIAVLLLLLLVLAIKAMQNKFKINQLLQKQNKEKEFLLKEIHHRVKNNLEIVSSLLSLQSAQIDDPDTIEAIQKSQQRVQSMSIIHQKLYQGKSLAAIEMKEYFKNLGDFIIDSFGAREQIILICDMKEIELNVDIAIPIGLIVNELISNSLKYAFTKDGSGRIEISLSEVGSEVHLKVADNGIGRIESDPQKGTGFGTQLIELLTKQLDGSMKLTVDNGTSVFFEFQLNKAA